MNDGTKMAKSLLTNDQKKGRETDIAALMSETGLSEEELLQLKEEVHNEFVGKARKEIMRGRTEWKEIARLNCVDLSVVENIRAELDAMPVSAEAKEKAFEIFNEKQSDSIGTLTAITKATGLTEYTARKLAAEWRNTPPTGKNAETATSMLVRGIPLGEVGKTLKLAQAPLIALIKSIEHEIFDKAEALIKAGAQTDAATLRREVADATGLDSSVVLYLMEKYENAPLEGKEREAAITNLQNGEDLFDIIKASDIRIGIESLRLLIPILEGPKIEEAKEMLKAGKDVYDTAREAGISLEIVKHWKEKLGI